MFDPARNDVAIAAETGKKRHSGRDLSDKMTRQAGDLKSAHTQVYLREQGDDEHHQDNHSNPSERRDT